MKISKTQIFAVVIFMAIPLLLAIIPKQVDTSKDGTYCADVKYFNPKTGKKSTYTVPVEVEDEQVIKINFYNGGWIDESHFEREFIIDGESTVITDENVTYKIKLLYDSDCD